jgi:ribonucleotide reductase beta subunit family protein with ferritin-like domain
MKPGDIVVYRGVDLEHSRKEFTPPADDWHVQAFFHYVDSNGPYSEYLYDQRESVGQLKKMIEKKEYIKYVN